MSTTAFSVCPHDCPSVCALEVEVLGPDRIGRVRGAGDNSYTAGVVCEKVARYAERLHHPDRLTRPLRRVGPKGAGAFEPIAWDEALDVIAARFAEAAERFGAQTVWPLFYAGTMGLVQRDGIERLRHVMGWSRQHGSICTALADAGWNAGVGAKRGPDPREMAESDLIIIWGGNPVATQVNVMTHVARARKTRGAKLIVIDPYRTGTAEVADRHLMLRPGTDGALACAVMHVLFRDGFADWEWLRAFTDAPDALEEHLRDRTPDWAAAITGLPAGEIEAFARLYGATPRAYIRVGYGFSRSRNGAANMHAVTCLPSVTGAWRHKGGGAFYGNSSIYPIDRTLIKGLDRIDPKTRVIDMCLVGRALTGDPKALSGGPPVTAMLIQSTNTALVSPEASKVMAGLSREDLFLVVHEQFMTDTARFADIVLPATMFLEHDDLYQAGGHGHLQIGRRAVTPLGETRSNHEVICALARRLGARHAGFELTAWELVDETLRRSGLPDAASLAEMRWLDLQPDFRAAHFLDGFPTPGGKFLFRPDWSRVGPDHAIMPSLPDHFAIIDEATEAHPFRLVTAPARAFLNSTFSETPTSKKRQGRPTLLVHPADCDALDMAGGDLARLTNDRGSVLIHVRPFDGVQCGVVIAEGIWPHGAFVGGLGINALVSADPGPPNGGGVFHDTAVRIERVAP